MPPFRSDVRRRSQRQSQATPLPAPTPLIRPDPTIPPRRLHGCAGRGPGRLRPISELPQEAAGTLNYG